jgi:hypothetical protein
MLTEIHPLVRYWSLIHSAIRELWAITEPRIEDAAIRHNLPVELYYYAELGLEYFSVEDFQRRDPFSNPEQFEKLFARLEIKDWILPTRESGRYQVPEKAREAVRRLVAAGDEKLLKFEALARTDLSRLLIFLKRIVLANNAAPEPPEKWATAVRFHTATRNSPVIVQIRECLMDIFAYRDDAHLSAARPYFNEAGIVWNAFSAVCGGNAVSATQIAEETAFRGYEARDFDLALQAAVEAGWVEPAGQPRTFRPTVKGLEMRAQVEKLTEDYFYAPWQDLSLPELDEVRDLLASLREELHEFRKTL